MYERKFPVARKWLIGVCLVLVLSSLACNLPGCAAATEVTESPEATTPPADTGQADGTAPTATLTETLPAGVTPTQTLIPTPTTCTFDAVFVDDITIPDGTQIVVGSSFEKTWRLRNAGCLDWPAGTTLIFDHGDQMGGPASVSAPATASNSTADVSVTLTAPNTPGTYKGYWQLRTPDGTRFGQIIYVEIEAVAPAVTDTPTPTLTPVPKPDLKITDIRVEPGTPLRDLPVTIYATVKNRGGADAPASKIGVSVPGAGGTVNIPALAAGATHEANFGFTMDAANYTVEVRADVDDQVNESDEGNNIATKDFTVHNWGTHTTKGLTVTWNLCAELDAGAVGVCGGTAEFMWNITTGGGGIVQYWLIPQGGAKFAVHGTSAPGILDCMKASLSSSNMDGGQYNSITSTLTPGSMPVGTYICYQTNEGRYGSFRVNERIPDLKLGYTTWFIN